MRSNSWVVTRKDTKEVVGEFFDLVNIDKFNTEAVIIETTYDYLCRLNKSIKEDYEKKKQTKMSPM